MRVGDLDWHVQIGGTGPVVLLLHGTGASAHSWSDVIGPLLASATLIVPDLPGHGFTSGGSLSSLTLPLMAKNLDALLEALGVSHIDLVAGHSAGAALAIRWTLGQVSPPGALVGFNSALIAPPHFYTQFVAPILVPIATSSFVAGAVAQLGTSTGMVNRLLTSTRSDVPPHQRQRYRTLFARPSHVQGAMGWMAAADLPALLIDAAELKSKATFVLGSEDQWVPRAAQEKVIRRAFPDASLLVWPGGHLLHEADAPRAAALLRARLAGSESTD